MRKLLSINNYYYRRGGAEVVFLEQNRLFQQAGWEVIPFAMRHKDNMPSDWEEYFIKEIEFGGQYSLLEKLVRVPKVIYSMESRKKIDSLLYKTKPDICHAHNIYHHISPSILSVVKRHSVPLIITLHDLKLACPAYKMLSNGEVCEKCKNGQLHKVITNRCLKDSLALSVVVYLEAITNKLLRSYINNVDKFVVPSQFYLNKLVEWGWDESKFAYIPNFVDTSELVPNSQNEAGNYFVYYGRLSEEKGLQTLIRAAANAKAELKIIGTGPDEQMLKNLVAELGSATEFLGYLTGESLFSWIRKSRAVVLPSEWYENAPMSVLESYALGKPVIGANIGGIPEIIREGETGAIYNAGSVDDLQRVLEEYINMNQNAIAEMGRVARTWVENNFTIEMYRDRMLKLYSQYCTVA